MRRALRRVDLGKRSVKALISSGLPRWTWCSSSPPTARVGVHALHSRPAPTRRRRTSWSGLTDGTRLDGAERGERPHRRVWWASTTTRSCARCCCRRGASRRLLQATGGERTSILKGIFRLDLLERVRDIARPRAQDLALDCAISSSSKLRRRLLPDPADRRGGGGTPNRTTREAAVRARHRAGPSCARGGSVRRARARLAITLADSVKAVRGDRPRASSRCAGSHGGRGETRRRQSRAGRTDRRDRARRRRRRQSIDDGGEAAGSATTRCSARPHAAGAARVDGREERRGARPARRRREADAARSRSDSLHCGPRSRRSSRFRRTKVEVKKTRTEARPARKQRDAAERLLEARAALSAAAATRVGGVRSSRRRT